MKKCLVIPSAVLIPENMRTYGEIPSGLYPINGKPILDYIVAQNKDFDIVISSYEKSELIEDYCNKKNGIINYKIKELGDLGYTIYQTLLELNLNEYNHLSINFADTYIEGANENSCDQIYYVDSTSINKKWTYIKEIDGKIISYFNKINIDDNNTNLKLFVGLVSFNHPLYLLRCLEECKNNNNECNFYEALKLYSLKYHFNFVKTNTWFDIGHPETSADSQTSVKARSFNHINIDKVRGIIIKKSDDIEKFRGEILWYLKLPKNLQYCTPRIYDYSIDYNSMYVSMEYYTYHTLLDIYIYGNLEKEKWIKILNSIKFIIKDFSNYTVKNELVKSSLEDMYISKTLTRLNKLKTDENFKYYFDNKIIINGTTYNSLNKIIDKSVKLIKDKLLNVDKLCIIHGDLCFANMLIDDNYSHIKLIDPRGKFGAFDIYGDIRYELAKLYHSVDGKYDLIIKDMFNLDINNHCFNYQMIENKKSYDVFDLMKNEFKDFIQEHNDEVEIIEALLFLSMIPLHNENLSHQYMMMIKGIEILSRHLDIKE